MAESTGKQPEVDPARVQASGTTPSVPKPPTKDRPKVAPLEGLKVKAVKPSLAARLRQSFTNDDSRSVGDYLLFDVAVPALKDLIFNLIQGGASRALYGLGATPRTQQRGSSINYAQISRTGPQAAVQPTMSARDRATFNFEGIVFPSRMEAERALTAMMETIELYGVFAVSDLYDLVNITGSFADDKWGWYNLQGADIVPTRGGFILDLPAVQSIK